MTDNQKIKILFLDHYPDIAGGQQSLMTILQHIDRENFDPMILTGDENAGFYNKLSEIHDLEVFTASLNVPKVTKKSDTGSHLSLRRIIKNSLPVYRGILSLRGILRSEQPDVVHCNTFRMALIASFVSRLFPSVVFVYHARTSRTAANHGILDRLVCGSMDYVVANSRYTKKSFDSITTCDNVLYSPIDFDSLNSDSFNTNLRKELGIGEETVLVTLVGRISPVKRYIEFIQIAESACEDHDDLHFVGVGAEGLDRGYVNKVRERIKNSSASDKISLYGYSENISSVYSATDILLHTARQEALGRVIIEAQYFGVPVVGPQSGGILEAVDPGTTALLAKDPTVSSISDTLMDLVTKPKLRNRIEENGKIFVKERFAAESITREHEKFWHSIASR